jgi:hypothetical protein
MLHAASNTRAYLQRPVNVLPLSPPALNRNSQACVCRFTFLQQLVQPGVGVVAEIIEVLVEGDPTAQSEAHSQPITLPVHENVCSCHALLHVQQQDAMHTANSTFHALRWCCNRLLPLISFTL